MAVLRRHFDAFWLFSCLHYSLASSSIYELHDNVENDAKNPPKSQNLRRAPHFNFPQLTDAVATPVQEGLTFTRTIKHLNEASFFLQLEDNHCKKHDKYGDNACSYEWGDEVLGNYTVALEDNIEHGDYMVGSFHIDFVVPYEFTCRLCGEPCVFEVPVLDITRTLDMPPCPIGPSFHSRVREQLMNFSPTAGVTTHLQGTVQLFRSNNETIADFSVSAYVK